jgi:hypothetical protein
MIDINYANLKVFARLVRHGFATEKQIVSMGIGDLTRIPKISAAEIRGINDFQQAIKTGNTLSFFIEETNEQPTTVEAEGQENDET